MQLVSDVSNWKKWWSMRFAILTAAQAAFLAGYAVMPAEFQAAVPTWIMASVSFTTLFTGVATAVSRVVQQNPIGSGGQR